MAVPIRLGLIGAGRWGRNYIRTINGLPGVRLARLASRNPDSARLIPTGCSIFTDWREMLSSRDLDGVIVATPPHLHAEMAFAAIDAGLAVLIEKPLTLSVAEAHALRERARERGVLAMVDHTHLFNPAFRALKATRPRTEKFARSAAKPATTDPIAPTYPCSGTGVRMTWRCASICWALRLSGPLQQFLSADWSTVE